MITRKYSFLLLIPVLILAGCNSDNQSANESSPGGTFTLESATGNVSLSDFQGKVVILYFGYTSCPDICPTSLITLASAIKLLDDEDKKHVQPVMISLDPERDSPEKLKQYVSHFYPNMIGLTGSQEDIRRIAKNYRINFRKKSTESSINYLVDHSSVYFIIGRDGKLFTHLLYDATLEEIAEKIEHALSVQT
ncbi:MAG TPA: SCO family protein [Chromatiales bacterium]|nr:SCO family protein [Thiotrichales bacterium]HIP67774.1 SCO family protein [Chromatiales bacterium]